MKEIKRVYATLVFLIAGVVASLPAQTTIRFVQENIKTIESLWTLQIQQLNTSDQSVYLLVTVREKNVGEIYRAKSSIFTVSSGLSVYTVSTIQPVEIQLNRLLDTDVLPNGFYWFQVALMDAQSNREIVTELVKTEVTGSVQANGFGTSPKEKKQSWSSSGWNRTSYNVMPPLLGNNHSPGQFICNDLQARLTLLNLPMEITGLYSTERGGAFGPVNQFAIRLDKEAVKAEALRWLSEKMSPEQLFDSSEVQKASLYRSALRDKRFPQYQGWREKYDSLHLEDNLRAQQQLHSLDAALGNKALKEQMSDLEKYRDHYNLQSEEDLSLLEGQIPDSVYHRMATLFRLEKSYRRMEKQREDLSEKAKQFRKYERLYKKVKSIERQQSITELAKDPDDIRRGLKNFGQADRLQTLLLGIDEFELGSCYPFFSPLTLNGVRIRGANIAYTTPRRWHIGITGGQKQRNVDIDTNYLYQNQSFYGQYLVGAQVGIGRPNGNFFYLQHLRSADYGDIPASIAGIADYQKPRSENFVTGLVFQYRDPQQIFVFSGEINQGLFNPDQAAHAYETSDRNNLSRFLGSTAKSGSALDWSYQGALKVYLPNGTTRITSLIHHVGAGYRSFGMPFMMQDITRYEVRANQDLFKSKLTIGGYYKRDYDQTSPLAKVYRTFTTSWGGQMRVMLKKNFILSADYAPYAQQNDRPGDTMTHLSKGNILVTSAQIRKKLGAFNLTTQGNWIFQNLQNSDTSTLYRIHSLQSSTQLAHSRYIFSMVGQYSPRRIQEHKKTTLYSIDVSTSFLQLFKRVNLTLGGQHIRETGATALDGVYTRASMRISSHLTIDMNFRHSLMERIALEERFVQDSGWLAMTVRW